MKIGRMLKGEGDYPKGALIAIHPAPGTAGALYVDEVRFDAWVKAGILEIPKDETMEDPTSKVRAKSKAKGVSRG
jgi:hypothetical protein